MPFQSSAINDLFLDGKRQRGDRDVDRIIRSLEEESGTEAIHQFFHALISQVEMPVNELPEQIQDFVADFKTPSWIDWDKIALTEEFFRDHGPRYLMVLYFNSLPMLYACANGAKVLTRTGRLAHDGEEMKIFARRIAETGQFLIHVLEKGGLNSKRGLHTILKIRFIHASIRSFVATRGWDEDALGVPVNQEDLAITLQTFSSAIIRGLEKSGITISEAEKAAVMHHWKVVGHCMGIDDDLLPDSYKEGLDLMERILQRQVSPSEDGKKLTRALIIFAETLLPGRLKNIPQMIITYFVSARIEEAIGLKECFPWYIRFLPHFLTRLFRITSRLKDLDPNIEKVIDRVAYRIVLAMVDYFNDYKGASFYVSESLRETWSGNQSMKLIELD